MLKELRSSLRPFEKELPERRPVALRRKNIPASHEIKLSEIDTARCMFWMNINFVLGSLFCSLKLVIGSYTDPPQSINNIFS
jgi:hypothetical protein